MRIIFESHATTIDNEARRASGWNDVALSKGGIKQASELGNRYDINKLDAVFCSDLKRAYMTAVLAFGENSGKIFHDWRLRECNYGDLTGRDSSFMDPERPKRIKKAFPNGESFEQANSRMKNFLDEVKARTDLNNVMIVGHRATHYGLETHIAGKSLEQCIKESLSWKWQPGWEYDLK